MISPIPMAHGLFVSMSVCLNVSFVNKVYTLAKINKSNSPPGALQVEAKLQQQVNDHFHFSQLLLKC